ncbi:ATPase, AAA family [Dictyocaulus viviparus]|uniref:ATPase, AAA family n=1 Tax=Dictyocaulus viviparus TaxID=29172 RepID=A0A0D8Y3Z6_DICVI|nr:ATPase, AAA family [Dictyocaulus viviparus]
MSWLFGMKPTSQSEVLSGANASEGSSDLHDENKIGQQQPPTRMSYSFDSTALERAAKAARELEKFPNAREALELSRIQEITRQKEVERDKKQLEAQIQAMKSDQTRIAEEERRKTLNEETKHARARADYQDQLARKRAEDELAMKYKMQEESLRKQEESVKRQESLRKATIEHELALKHKYELEKIEVETKARAKAARDNRDVNLEQMKLHEEENRKTVVEKIRTSGILLGAGLQDFLSDKKKMSAAVSIIVYSIDDSDLLNSIVMLSIQVGSLTALAIGWYIAKRGTGVVARYAEARLGKPSLVRETSRITPLETIKHPIKTAKMLFRPRVDPLEGVVLSPNAERQLRDIAITTANTRRNKGLFRNVLFFGPPGTGKTLFAKRLAQYSGLDYAILTGGDIAPMGRDGVSAIHKVFDWASNSRKGLILFIDEADAFLQKRSKEAMSEDTRAALNAFLFRTGEQSRNFMIVVASNQPEQFDWAVNDRLDQIVEFELPGRTERERILLQYFEEHIAKLATSVLFPSDTLQIIIHYYVGVRGQRLKLAKFDWIKKCSEIAEMTEGLSGRELNKLVIGWQAAAYASEDGVLTSEMIDRNTNDAVSQHEHKMEWLEKEQLAARNKEVMFGTTLKKETAV